MSSRLVQRKGLVLEMLMGLLLDQPKESLKWGLR